MIGNQTAYAPSVAQDHLLLQRVSFLLGSGLVVSALAAWQFQTMVSLVFPFLIATFVLLFVMQMTRRKPGINVVVFYLFCLAEGGALGPLLSMYAKTIGPYVVAEAFALTSIIVLGVGAYAYTSKQDFGFLGKTLIWVLLAMILVGLVSVFVGVLQTPIVTLGYETIIVAVFVGFLLYDFSNIRRRYSPDDYIMAAVSVYLDFINLFLAILRILAILQGGGVSRRN